MKGKSAIKKLENREKQWANVMRVMTGGADDNDAMEADGTSEEQ